MSDVPEIIIDQINGPKLILSNSQGELKEIKFNDNGTIELGTQTILLDGDVSAFPDIPAIRDSEEKQYAGSSANTRLTFENNLDPGDYEAILSFSWRLNSANPDFIGSLVLGETEEIWNMRERPRSASNQKIPVSTIVPFTISDNNINKLEFKYYCNDKKKIAYVSNAYLKVKRVK